MIIIFMISTIDDKIKELNHLLDYQKKIVEYIDKNDFNVPEEIEHEFNKVTNRIKQIALEVDGSDKFHKGETILHKLIKKREE